MKTNFAEYLTALRKRAGFNQIDFAEEVGVSVDTVRRWEGGTQEPRLGELQEIAKTLGMSIEQLVGDESVKELGNVRNVKVRKRNASQFIVIQQGKTRIEIPATKEGYSIIGEKLRTVDLGDISVSDTDLAVVGQ